MNITELYAPNNIKGIGPKAILKILDVMKLKKLNSILNIDVDGFLECGELSR